MAEMETSSMRILLNLILHFMVLIVMLPRTKAAVETAQTLPGCPDKCGNITIPYPFGTRKGCYLSKHYQVYCKKLGVWKTNLKLLEISLDGHMRGSLPMGYSCYNKDSKLTSWSAPRITLSRFPISSTHNLLTAVGCDTGADIRMTGDGQYVTGCLSGTDCNNIRNGSCLGIGCSQVLVAHSLTNFQINALSISGKVGSWGFNNCTYAFLVEKRQYTFLETDLDNMQNRSFPVVLEWWVGNMSCEEAKNNTGYICKEHSLCNDIVMRQKERHLGYRCQCAQGYNGNPYLPNGCKDINECDSPQNDCIYTCRNTQGSYNCTCPLGHYGDGRKNGSGCSYSGEAKSLVPVYITERKRSRISYQGIIMGTAASIVLTFVLYWGLKQRRIMKSREMLFKKNGGLILQKLLFESKESSHTVKIFAAGVLEKATNNFHKANVIGQGGYGTVYKGTLEDKTTVAIKQSKSIDESQIEQFINELIILSEISHPYVVKLLGCCLETQTPLLVYEFVTNKTVFDHLHNQDFLPSLTFEQRLDIATQTARALDHIHSTTQIIHRDIKSSNILLTDDYIAKVSDFGISRFIPIDQSHIQTLVHGTLGYIDPEYFRSGILTEKSDVYSFGMVLVELLTGRKVFSPDGTESEFGLAMFFVSSLERGCLIEVLDDQVKELDGLNEHVKYIAKLAKECVELEGKKRPCMEIVKMELEEIRKAYIMEGLSHLDQ